MARLLFVNRFYWPDETATGQLLTDLAEALAARGHDVTIVTSRPPHLPPHFTAQHNGVRIAHVGSTRATNATLAAKALDFATFYCGALGQLLLRARRGTIIVALTDPPLIGIGAAFVAALRGARLIHWVQDIYPELAMQLAGQSWLRVVRPLRNAAWRRAAACVTLGRDMADRLRRAGVSDARLDVIPNWAPHGVSDPAPQDVLALRAAWGLADKFVIGYSGNLGRVHDLDAVLELAAALAHQPAIAVVIIGGGAQREGLRAAVNSRGLGNVTFFPAQPRASLAASLGVPDLHLVTLKAGCEDLVFPSKLYGIVAASRPVLFIGPPTCDVARVVKDNGIGLVIARGEVSAVVPTIARLAAPDSLERARYAEALRRFAARHPAAIAVGHWSALLERVAGSRPGPASSILPRPT